MLNSLFAFPQTQLHMQEGPLGRHVSDYATLLHEQGYSRHSIAQKIRLVADWSRWLQPQGLEAKDMNSHHLARYLQHRHKRLRPSRGDPSTLQRFLEQLRQQGICPSERSLVSQSRRQQEEEAFGRYLSQERGLCPSTLVNYLPFVRQFLAERFGHGPIRFAQLCAKDVTGHVQRHAPLLSQGRKPLLLTALRSFLRYLRHQGAIPIILATPMSPTPTGICPPLQSSWL